jgi:hypothetical protein
MSTAPQIFMLFFAICWGTAANAQPRWKAFDWSLVAEDAPSLRRCFLSFALLNLLPILYFAAVLIWLESWTTSPPSRFVQWLSYVAAVLPALSAFGFYRLWMSIDLPLSISSAWI